MIFYKNKSLFLRVWAIVFVFLAASAVFAPLEKAPGGIAGGYQGDDGGFSREANLPLVEKPQSSITVSPVRKNICNGIEGRSSLTGFAGQSYYVYSAQDACGAWQKGKIGEKETIFTDRADVYEYMELEVPESGYYQVYLSLYHNWRKDCPFLYCKLIDSKGKIYLNHVFSEPRWYIEEGQGRWEYRCLSAEPYWYLHKGKVKIKFWVEAKKSCWEREDVLMPSSLAVGEFVLIPVDMKERTHVNLTLP